MLDKGKFIVVEGLEGAGKSTAMDVIKQTLLPHVPELVITREPGGTHTGEVVRGLIREIVPEEPLDPRAELLLFYAARVQLIEQVIRPALNRGAWVLADRFELSTLAYQGAGRKLSSSMIEHLSKFCIRDLVPDLIIFMDVTPEEGMRRVIARGKTDRIEQESMAFFHDVYEGYHQHIQCMDNVEVIDASKPLPAVQSAIRTVIENHINHYANG
jgi:dTMP kinase